MYFKFFMLGAAIIFSLSACESKERVKAPNQNQSMGASHQTASAGHTVTVEEVIQAKSYTYLRVNEGNQEYWIATAKQIIEKGQTLNYSQGLEMKNFTSKELGRDFETIWFVGQMSGSGSMSGKSPASSQLRVMAQNISVEKVAGGVTIQELYSNPSAYEGKTVTIRGEVTKFNSRIMDRNWVHIQDGTHTDGSFDLTVTTMANIKAGDVVVFQGKIALNKDFGAGYTYDLIMEEATLVNEG